MKNLLVVPFVLLSFCIIADDRIILGSFERETTDADTSEFTGETTLNGVGARLYNFKDEGLYLGAGFASRNGDYEICALGECITGDASTTNYSGEVGRDMGNWIPFVGLSFSSSEVKILGVTDVDETTSVNAGLWLELDTFKLRGALTDLDDSDSRAINGGLLFQMDNDFVLGAEFGMLLDSEVDGFRFSFQFGRKF